jgi:hypothetical protein
MENHSMDKTTVWTKPQYGQNHSMENLRANALSTNKENALSISNQNALSYNIENALNDNIPPKAESDIEIRNNLYLSLVNKLVKIIVSTKNIKINQTKIKSYCNSFRKLYEVDGVSRKRMLEALIWYESHVGEPYVPIIESGDSFKSKFLKLEDAIERNNKPIHEKYNKPSKSGGHKTPGGYKRINLTEEEIV